MARNLEFEEFAEGLSEAEIRQLEAIVNKSFKKWLKISLIPVVNWVTMGYTIFCYNTLSFIRSRGYSKGNNFIRFLMMFYGDIIGPLIVVNICASNDEFGRKILGLTNNTKKSYKRR